MSREEYLKQANELRLGGLSPYSGGARMSENLANRYVDMMSKFSDIEVAEKVEVRENVWEVWRKRK